jgi:hypothetical protein
MDRISKLHRKIILSLSQLMEDEEAELTKQRRIRMVFFWLGMLLVIASLIEARDPHWPVWMFSLVGATGGLVVGLGFHYDNAINQWPAMKPFLDGEKLKDAVKEYNTE